MGPQGPSGIPGNPGPPVGITKRNKINKTSKYALNIVIWIKAYLSNCARTHPFPNPTLYLTCYQSTVVGLREGWVRSRLDTDFDPFISAVCRMFVTNKPVI